MSTTTCVLYADRGFSVINRIKDKAAATLRDEILTDILVIKALGPKILNGGVAEWATINAILHNAIFIGDRSPLAVWEPFYPRF